MLAKNTLLFGVGEILNKLFPFFLIPILTQGFGIEKYGEYAYFISLTVVLSIVINYGMELAVARYYHFKGRRYLMSIYTHHYSVVLFLVLFISMFLPDKYILVLFVSLIQGAFNSILSILVSSGKVYTYIIIQFIQAGVSFLGIILFFHFGFIDIKYCLYAIFISNFISVSFGFFCVITQFNKKRKLKLGWNKYFLSYRYLSQFGFKVMCHQISQASKGNADKLFLFPLVSPGFMSVYSASFQLAIVLQVALMAINKALIPTFYKSVKSGFLNDNIIRKIALASIFFSPSVYIMTSFIPDVFYEIILGDGFHEVSTMFPFIVTGVALNLPYMIIGNYYFAKNNNGTMALISLFGAVIYVAYIYLCAKWFVNLVPFGLIFANTVVIFLLFGNLSKVSDEKYN